MKKLIFILITAIGVAVYYFLSRLLTSGIPEDKGIAILLISISMFAFLCTYIPRKVVESIFCKKNEKSQ